MIPQIQELWNNIGSAWDNFEDKDLIEKFWLALASGNQQLYSHVGNVQFSRVMDLMYPTFDYGPQAFYIIYSGLSTEINVVPVVETEEQILNGTFDSNTYYWDLNYGMGGAAVRSSAQSRNGGWSLLLGPQGVQAMYPFGKNQLPSSTAEVWFYIESTGSSLGTGNIGVDLIDSDGNIISTAATDDTVINTWQKVTLYSHSTNVRGLVVRNDTMGTNVYVDDVSFKKSGYFEYSLPEFTYSIPSIGYNYKYNGITYSGIYTEGIDYLISSEMNSLIWIKEPTKDLRYATTGVINGVADHLYRINPVLGNVWASQCGFKIQTHYPKYESFGQNKYKHLKMLIWSLDYYQNQAPSIHTLRNAYGIARGLPFTYSSGIMDYSLTGGHYDISMGADVFVLPSGVYPKAKGYYNQFEVLASGLELHDYTTNPSLLDAYATPYARRCTLIYQLDPTVSGISFSQDFLDIYMAQIMPEQIQYITI